MREVEGIDARRKHSLGTLQTLMEVLMVLLDIMFLYGQIPSPNSLHCHDGLATYLVYSLKLFGPIADH